MRNNEKNIETKLPLLGINIKFGGWLVLFAKLYKPLIICLIGYSFFRTYGCFYCCLIGCMIIWLFDRMTIWKCNHSIVQSIRLLVIYPYGGTYNQWYVCTLQRTNVLLFQHSNVLMFQHFQNIGLTNRTERDFICAGKWQVVFWVPQNIFSAWKHLPLQGAENASEVSIFFGRYNVIFNGMATDNKKVKQVGRGLWRVFCFFRFVFKT